MLRSILIGLDGSAYNAAALELGTRWAQQFDATLVGLGIVDEPTICRPEPVPIGGGAFKRERDEERLADARRKVERLLQRFVSHCDRLGVHCETLEDVGLPAERIVEQSKLHDLIVLGRQTFFQFETQYDSDNTLWRVLRQCSRPLVTVPENVCPTDRVLVAYNGSPVSDRALVSFQALGLADKAEVHVLSIGADSNDAGSHARQAAKFLELHGIEAAAHVRAPAQAAGPVILDEARAVRAGLIVMGACGRARWREWVFGSTTWEVIEASPVPVFLCH